MVINLKPIIKGMQQQLTHKMREKFCYMEYFDFLELSNLIGVNS